jgi:alpha-tubulin suppressor-like RCC1 family protein
MRSSTPANCVLARLTGALTSIILLLGTPALGLAPRLLNAAPPPIAAGSYHSVATAWDGTVYAWGQDNSGQLGLSETFSSVPLRIAGFTLLGGSGSPRIAAGGYHSAALMPDGSVWTWGDNDNGQLGNGTTVSSGSPGKVPGLANAIAIAAGNMHTLAMKSDGSVWAWGDNGYGQLGIGTFTYIKSSPQPVPNITNAIAVAGGGSHSIALKSDRSVWAWGSNGYGQLGDGTTANRSLPVQVLGLTGVVAVAAGAVHTLALKSDGTVWAWGTNANGELGDGTTTNRSSPVKVSGLASAISVSAGDGHSVAVRSDGTVWTWGKNIWGQLGDGTNANRSSPVQVPGLTGVIAAVAGGKGNGAAHTLAVKSDGSLWAWGYNRNGQLGDGTTVDRNLPVQVGGVNGLTAVAGGSLFSMALKSDGTVWAWGNNDYGQIGNGRILARSAPSLINQIGSVVAVAAGQDNTVALRSDGSVWAWGSNFVGQLGDGTTTDRARPAQVTGLSNAVSIAAGAATTLAAKSDGTVWAWGFTFGGGRSSIPVQVPGLSSVVAVSNSYSGMLALKSDGTVWGWSSSGWPVQLPGLSQIVGISGSSFHALAVRSDGTVWAWGNNGAGQLGDGTTASRSSAMQVLGVTGVVAVAAGGDHSLALKSDGSVWAWGSGAAGTGNVTYRSAPAQVPGLTGVVAVAAGNSHSLAVKADGSVLAWGWNNWGVLGDGTLADRFSPVLVVNTSVDGFLKLTPGSAIQPPPGLTVPFFVSASGAIKATSATVSTLTKFNAADVGKTGAVYVTAMVPTGTTGTLKSAAVSRQGAARELAGATDSSFVLIQLTPSGWQQVVSGQLIPYASGVLGDQLAAQTILSNTDPTTLAGAQFCVGYGTSANDMIAAGKMRVVATISASGTNTATVSCIGLGSVVGGVPSSTPGGVMTSFATRGTVTPTTPMYGSFAVANTSVMYVAVRGPSLGTLGYTQTPLDLPNVRVYDASGKDALGSIAAGCPGSGPVANYYANLGGPLDARDTCVSGSFSAGVYTFTLNPNTSSSSGELLFEVRVNPTTTTPGGVMTSFATRGTVTPTTPMYGSFAVANSSVMYVAVRGPSLGTLGYTQNPLDLPNLRVYDASGKDALGSIAAGCSSGSTVSNYYANLGGALNTRDTCVSAILPAGVYTFTINPNTASSSGELLFEVRVNP